MEVAEGDPEAEKPFYGPNVWPEPGNYGTLKTKFKIFCDWWCLSLSTIWFYRQLNQVTIYIYIYIFVPESMLLNVELVAVFRTTSWMERDNGEVSSRGFVSFSKRTVCIMELLARSCMHTHAHAGRICNWQFLKESLHVILVNCINLFV